MITFHSLLWVAVKLLAGIFAVIYAILVYAAYEMEGAQYQTRFQLTNPARSGERLLIWTGVKVVDAGLRFARSILDQLFAASAEVGEWAVGKSSPAVQRKVRSRFL
ncbi:MAG: hypothetical protein ACRD19_12795 [Terriglobia bacterium]